ncbi:MAG: response regulator transcription factor [Lachnospiraceae bacterium]|jgi:DNA-binding response OmpR family regulator|nr:response regulator transcription factor [Lachnospiraceae bacterium]MCI8997098.1 response regulator transcription factor [Lachnospiraceae bacterium]MCI9135507.1 response regulator transcription factor [Lachnospiraceae bacterium]
MKRILIVEDDAENNQMLREYLEGHGYVCTQAFSGSEGKLLFSMEEFDLILLDLMLPGISGEELVGIFSQKTPVIVLSAKSGLDSKVDVLSAGAEDYLCKPFDLQELLVRIQVQLRRKDRESGSGRDSEPENTVYQYRQWKLNPDTLEMTAAGEPVTLTKHEFLILELLIRNPRRIFSKQMIYEYVWGEEYLAEDKTIHVHMSNIRAKLKASGTDSYIQTVWGMGFKLT